MTQSLNRADGSRPLPTVQVRELNGLNHRVIVHEAQDGAPTLVLLHGFLDCAQAFDPFVGRLQRRLPLRVVAPDLRGHGGTEWIGRGGYYHFADYVADVHALLASETQTPLAVLGHSMGGTIASLLAGAFPQRVSRLVLVEGLGPIASDEAPPDRMRRWIAEVDARRGRTSTPMTLEDAVERLARAHPRVDRAEIQRLALVGTREVEGGRVWAYDPLHRTRSPMATHVADFNQFLVRIACPTLLIDGADSPFSTWVTDDRKTRIRALTEATVANAGHMIHLEQPEALVKLVADFLQAD